MELGLSVPLILIINVHRSLTMNMKYFLFLSKPLDGRLCVSVECVVNNLIKYKRLRKRMCISGGLSCERLSINVERGVRDYVSVWSMV